MPMPQEYFAASRDFEAFMADAKTALGHGSHHQTYTTVQAVLTVFRRRLSVGDALRFAGVLPPVLRAIFVSDWDVADAQKPFGPRGAMEAEVRAFREHHNFAPTDAISTVAGVMRKHVDTRDFERVLSTLPDEAQAYWDPAGN